MDSASFLPLTLLDLLSNSLVLRQLAPYLPFASALALMSTSRSFRQLLYDEQDTFRYLNVSTVTSAILPYVPVDIGGICWRSQRMDESLTADEFYFGPVRGICYNLRRMNILNHVQTLILDGMNVPADLVDDIISDARSNVRVLSLREANINETMLMQALNYAVRSTRAEGSPRLRALYILGARDQRSMSHTPALQIGSRRGVEGHGAGGVMSSEGAQIGAQWNERSQDVLRSLNAMSDLSQDRWYRATGRMFKKPPLSGWANTLKACEGIIAFDAVLCRGPKHNPDRHAKKGAGEGLPPAVATVALGQSGCSKCGSSVEGPGIFDQSPTYHLPLLAPPPLHSSSLRAAQKPFGDHEPQRFFARCEDCLRGRWCERCLKWWDEDCYSPPTDGKRLPEVSPIDDTWPRQVSNDVSPKIYLGLCTERCLVSEMMSGAGSNGMWG